VKLILPWLKKCWKWWFHLFIVILWRIVMKRNCWSLSTPKRRHRGRKWRNRINSWDAVIVMLVSSFILCVSLFACLRSSRSTNIFVFLILIFLDVILGYNMWACCFSLVWIRNVWKCVTLGSLKKFRESISGLFFIFPRTKCVGFVS